MAQPSPTVRTPRPPWVAVAVALALVYVVWGSTYLGIRIVTEDADPLTAMGTRYVAAGLLLGLVVAARRGLRSMRVTRRQLLGCAFLGLMLPLLGNGVVAVAEARGATSGTAALLIAVAPLAIVVFRLAERDVPKPQTLLGVVSGFVGLAVLVLIGSGDPEGSPLGPSLLVLAAGSCWALGSYLQPRVWLPDDAFVVTVWEMLLGGAMATVAGLLAGETIRIDHDLRTWTAWGYLVVFGSVVAFSSYVWLLGHAPISLVATYAYINPVVAVFLGWLVLDERITVATAVGGGIVVASVAIVITSERRRPAAVVEPERVG